MSYSEIFLNLIVYYCSIDIIFDCNRLIIKILILINAMSNK